MRASLLGILPFVTACVGDIPTHTPALARSGSSEICRNHRGINAVDVYGNDMYVRCNDGTILTR